MRERLKSTRGLAWITVVLLAAVLAMLAWFAVDGYLLHLRDVRMTFDREQVNTALRSAKVQYLTDGLPRGITYYYDAENLTFRSFDEIGLIKGYGRSYESENLHAETGARGIPNLGGSDGAQLLAIAFENEESISIRWQGHFLTPYDMEQMTTAEQARLTTEQRNQIEISRKRQEEGEK